MVVICGAGSQTARWRKPLIDSGKNRAFNWRLRCGYGAGRSTGNCPGNTAGAGDLNRCLKRRMRRIRHVALINKQGGRNAESRCQFLACSSVNFLFPLKTRDTIDLLPISGRSERVKTILIHKGTNHSYTARHGLRHGIKFSKFGR